MALPLSNTVQHANLVTDYMGVTARLVLTASAVAALLLLRVRKHHLSRREATGFLPAGRADGR